MKLLTSSILVINNRDLEYFASVAEHGHVGRAAESLGMSQSGLSMCLRRLEKAVRAKLFQRTPKGVTLTAAGSALLLRVSRLKLAHEDVMQEIAELGEGSSGHVRLGVSPGMAEDLSTLVCSRLARESPKVTLNIAVGTFNALLPQLRAGALDLIFSGIPKSCPDDLVQEHLCNDTFVVYASINHRLARRKQVTLSDLTRERWITTDTFILWQELKGAFEQNKTTSPNIAVETSSAIIRHGAVSSTELLGFGSSMFLRRSAQHFGLVALPVKGLSVSRTFGVSQRKDAYLSPVALNLIELFRTILKNYRMWDSPV